MSFSLFVQHLEILDFLVAMLAVSLGLCISLEQVVTFSGKEAALCFSFLHPVPYPIELFLVLPDSLVSGVTSGMRSGA